jgi:hypothetical protein
MAQRKIYRSMQGKIVDLEKLTTKHELTPAIGNARVNARGDELGPGGKIIRKREDVMAEYYANNPNAVKEESARKMVTSKAPELEPKNTNTNKPSTSE